jgi:hypothetical protein
LWRGEVPVSFNVPDSWLSTEGLATVGMHIDPPYIGEDGVKLGVLLMEIGFRLAIKASIPSPSARAGIATRCALLPAAAPTSLDGRNEVTSGRFDSTRPPIGPAAMIGTRARLKVGRPRRHDKIDLIESNEALRRAGQPNAAELGAFRSLLPARTPASHRNPPQIKGGNAAADRKSIEIRHLSAHNLTLGGAPKLLIQMKIGVFSRSNSREFCRLSLLFICNPTKPHEI